MWGGAGAGSSRRGGARLLKAAGLPPPPPSWRARLRVHAATPRRRRRPAGAWAWSRRQQRRQGRRDPGRTEPVSVQRLARARTARQRAASTVCGRLHVATLVVSPVKGHAAAESGERACAAAHVGAGGGQSLSTGGARLTSRPFGSALAAVCNGVHSSAGETTTTVHLCATRGSWRWTRVAAGTHWSLCIHLTHECHSCSAATGP